MRMVRGVTAAEREWREDPTVHAVTLMVSVRQSGESHGVLGVRSMTTGRYVFHALPLVTGEAHGRSALATAVLWHATAVDAGIRYGEY